jgi:hypothetical protein
MQRTSIMTGAKEIQAAIESSQIYKHISPAPSERAKANFAATLSALNSYSLAASKYSNAAKGIANIFGIDALENTNIWEHILAGENSIRSKITRSLSTISIELPKVLELIQQHSVVEVEEIDEIDSSDEVSAMNLSFIEEDGQFSTVQRIIQGLSACEELYRAIQTIYSNSTTPLAIGAIDSGSDKSFTLFGSAEAIKELRLLIVDIWDRVVFHKENKMGRKLELIEKSLPIIEKIKAMEQEGKLAKEESRIAINQITDGTKMFIAAGVMTNDIVKTQKIEPRLLLAPEPRLLAAPKVDQATSDRIEDDSVAGDLMAPSDANETGNKPEDEWESLSPDEREKIIRLAMQSRKDNPR